MICYVVKVWSASSQTSTFIDLFRFTDLVGYYLFWPAEPSGVSLIAGKSARGGFQSSCAVYIAVACLSLSRRDMKGHTTLTIRVEILRVAVTHGYLSGPSLPHVMLCNVGVRSVLYSETSYMLGSWALGKTHASQDTHCLRPHAQE